MKGVCIEILTCRPLFALLAFIETERECTVSDIARGLASCVYAHTSVYNHSSFDTWTKKSDTR